MSEKSQSVEKIVLDCRNCGHVFLSKIQEKVFFSSGNKLSGRCPDCGKNPMKILKPQKESEFLN